MDYQLIHANLGLAKYPTQSREMASFWQRANIVNRAAEDNPGFIREIDVPDRFSFFPEPHILNASAWQDLKSLKSFVYGGRHAEALKLRRAWFTEHEYPNYLLYWAPKCHEPTEQYLAKKFLHLKEKGATPVAFTFKESFAPNNVFA